MTHDELLARITNQAGWTDNHVNDRVTVVVSDWNAGWNARDNANALRAVVELHRPDKFGFCYCSDIPGKCPTKESIEKGLK